MAVKPRKIKQPHRVLHAHCEHCGSCLLGVPHRCLADVDPEVMEVMRLDMAPQDTAAYLRRNKVPYGYSIIEPQQRA